MSRIVRLLSQNVGTSCDALQQDISLLAFAHLNTLLDHVVAVAVLHHDLQYAIKGLSVLFILVG